MAYKIARAALDHHNVNVFLYLDAVNVPRLGQRPGILANAGRSFEELALAGATIRVCPRCAAARGLNAREDGSCFDYHNGIKISSLYDLAEMLEQSDRVIFLSR